MKVIIAEKPDVARSIARVLNVTNKNDGYISNDEYSITWCFGHLVGIADPEAHGYSKKWLKEELPLLPSEFQLAITDDAGIKKQFNIISSLFSKASEIIVATDAGREGELIFRYVYEMSGSSTPFKRLWISSLTDEAIELGLSKLMPGSSKDNLYYSAKARSESDWLLGLNATRALTLSASTDGVLSLGRVQTPVLAMICQRYKHNTEFKATDYFVPSLKLNKDIEFNANYDGKFDTQEEAQNILNSVADSIVCSSAEEKERKEKQPKLFDLTLLQREANKLYKYGAKQTLDIAQSLYEKHKVLSYPRTDSNYLSEDIYTQLPKLFSKMKGSSFGSLINDNVLTPLPKVYINDKEVSDHHAIIPTGQIANGLSQEELNIYNLVVLRFIAAFSDVCIKSVTSYVFGVEHCFKASGTVVISKGWRSVYSLDEKEEGDNQTLPRIAINDAVNVAAKNVLAKKTKPQPIHSEASLLGMMESAGKEITDDELSKAIKDSGIGTPATRAAIIETLFARKYVLNEQNKLIPTKLGLQVFDLVKDYDMAKPDLTGNWEFRLNQMSEGSYDYAQFISEIKVYTKSVVEQLLTAKHSIEASDRPVCPSCKKGNLITGQKGTGCSRWNDTDPCKFVIWHVVADKKLSPKHIEDLITKGITAEISGFKSSAGKLFAAKLKLENGAVSFSFPDAIPTDDLVSCPSCGTGKIRESKIGFSCDRYKEGCSFTIWKNNAKISYQDVKLLLSEGKPTKVFTFKNKKGESFKASLSFENKEVKTNFAK